MSASFCFAVCRGLPARGKTWLQLSAEPTKTYPLL